MSVCGVTVLFVNCIQDELEEEVGNIVSSQKFPSNVGSKSSVGM